MGKVASNAADWTIGRDVIITGNDGETAKNRGTVAGHARLDSGDYVVVRLPEGFYGDDRVHFVSMIVVHPSNLRPA